MPELSFPTSERLTVQLTLPDKLALEHFAKDNGFSLSAVIRLLVIKYASHEFPLYEEVRDQFTSEIIGGNRAST